MNEHLRDRILRKLETLSDERGYQVLDYVEFLESRYAERQSQNANTFTRFTEAIVARAVDQVEDEHPELVGGLGLYTSHNYHTPYVHIDTRGTRSRWKG